MDATLESRQSWLRRRRQKPGSLVASVEIVVCPPCSEQYQGQHDPGDLEQDPSAGPPPVGEGAPRPATPKANIAPITRAVNCVSVHGQMAIATDGTDMF